MNQTEKGEPLGAGTLGSAVDKWRRFRRLNGQEHGTLLRSLAVLPLLALALRLLGFRRLQMTLARLTPDRESMLDGHSDSAMHEGQLAARMVETASRDGLVHGNCLEQSLTLWWLLRRRHIPAQLRIGVQKQADEFQAHAWVELGGTVLNDRHDVHQEYRAFARDIGTLGVDVR